MKDQLTSSNLIFEYLPIINYAITSCGMKYLNRCELWNDDTEDWYHVKVSISGDMLTPSECLIDMLPSGCMVNVDRLSITPDISRLRNMTESVETQFTLQVSIGGQVVYEQPHNVRVMAFDHWPGTGIMPELTACFVTPNSPALAQVKIDIARHLERLTESTSLDDYQTQDPNRVRAMVASVYEALREQGIIYITPPPSFEEDGQRVRMCEQVLKEKAGTCLDLSMLFASCLESIGLFPLLVLYKGHMFVGCWLEKKFYPQPICNDVSFLSKSVADGINDIVVVESTMITQKGVPFEKAVKAAEDHLHLSADDFIMAFDIFRCRQQGIRPLSLSADAIQDVTGISLDHATDEIMQMHQYDLNIDEDRKLTRQQIWERKLLDFSLRNNLLNLRIGKKVTPFLSFSLDELEDHLQAKEDYKILPLPLSKRPVPDESGLYDSRAYRELAEKIVTEGIQQHMIYSYLPEDELQTTLKNLFRASRTALEENGANTLFLVLGLLKWYENPKSVKPRYAPLLLEPVDIVKKSGNNYVLRVREEDITFNTTLVEMMKQQYNIHLSGVSPLPVDDSGVDVRKVFSIVRATIKDHSRWDVVEEGLLGLFSFNKFVMWNDIHNNAEKMRQSPVVESLIQKRLVNIDTQTSTDTRRFDTDVAPSTYAIPVDVDSSQLEAVIESGEGRSFILYGPPGTGKSQTITNMIANALYHDRRVLFVAEKMAALEVVQKRLAKIGLDPFCLEMHSNKMTKSHLLQQLQSALDLTRIKSSEEYEQESQALFEQRRQLIQYIDQLHRLQPSGLSLYDYISRYLSYDSDDEIPPMASFTDGITTQRIADSEAAIKQLGAVFHITGLPSSHPLYGLLITSPSLDTQQRVEAFLQQTGKMVPEVRNIVRQIAHANGIVIDETLMGAQGALRLATAILSAPAMSGDILRIANNPKLQEIWSHHINTGVARDRLYADITRKYSAGVFSLDIAKLKSDWAEACGKWFLGRYFAKKSLVKSLRVYSKDISSSDIEPLIAQMEQYQALDKDLSARYEGAERMFGQIAHRGKEQWSKMEESIKAAPTIMSILRTLGVPDGQIPTVSQSATQGIPLDMLRQFTTTCESYSDYCIFQDGLTFDQMITRLPQWLVNIGKSRDWSQWCLRRQDLISRHQQPVVYYIEEGHDSEDTLKAMMKGLYKRLALSVIDQEPVLQSFNGMIFEEKIAKYRDMAKQFQDLTKRALYCKLASRIPSLTIEAANSSEIGILKRLIASGGRGSTIRHIIDQIPTLLPKLCPCMLMSPISVAQFIDLDQEKFDIVVFDEASQMPTSEAVGAIARGKALIVVGDPKQMPPTSFFTTTSVDESEAENDDMESILDDCITLTFPDHYLTWHYRSRHESLIAFSNSQYYEGRLYTFPSVDDRSSKVRFIPVEGTYDYGKSRSNRAEAEAIVKEVVRRLSDDTLSKRSIGIVSFSKVQQDLIEDILVEELSKNMDLEKRAYDCEEPIFVKNLENVQGDERDIILFSVGYGPDKNGRVSMNFGPLNNNGGERRLNVAVSRARYEMMVFSTLHPEQIDLNRSHARGVEGLKRFLEFAKSGRMPVSSSQLQEQSATSLIDSIAAEIRAHGYEVDTHVGRSRFKIDLAVIDPSSPADYLMGIICDGPNYFSTPTARDREICQPGVLQGLGWNLMRVWTIDWFLNSQNVTDRIIQALDDLVAKRQAQQSAPPAVSSLLSQPASKPQPQSKSSVSTVAKDEKPRPSDSPGRIAHMPFEVSEDDIIEIKNDKEIEYKMTGIRPHYTNANQDVLALSRRQVNSDIQEIIKTEQPVTLSTLRKRIMYLYGQSRQTDRLQHALSKGIEKAYVDPSSAPDNPTFWVSAEAAKDYDKYRKANNRDVDDIPLIEIKNIVRLAVTQQVSVKAEDILRQVAKLLGFVRRTARTDAAVNRAIDQLTSEGIIKSDGTVITVS